LSNEMGQLVQWAGTAGQYLFAVIGLYMLLQLLPRRRARWQHLSLLQWKNGILPDQRLRPFLLSRDQQRFKERELLLAACGVTRDAAWYAIGYRLLQLLLIVIVLVFTGLTIWRSAAVSMITMLAVLLPLGALLLFDLPLLRAWGKLRSIRMTKEIFVVSNQLLYLAESSLNIHAKLTRCVPFTKLMRGDFELLLAEWYYDAGEALQHFKKRLGTEDAMTFVETIDALREHESSSYYELLKSRIEDYKEKLELDKEGRRETLSYGLFIIAGIPILYTFQVFIYPWVSEGQKLLQSLS